MAENQVKLYDIYDIYYEPFWKQSWFFLTIFGFLCMLLGICFYLLYKYFTKKKPLSLWDQALYEMRELDMTQEHISHKEFYIQLTSILKRYLEARFAIELTGTTDDEMLVSLKQSDLILPHVYEEIEAIVSGIQEVKFAKKEAVLEHMKRAIHLSETIVEQTKEKETKDM